MDVGAGVLIFLSVVVGLAYVTALISTLVGIVGYFRPDNSDEEMTQKYRLLIFWGIIAQLILGFLFGGSVTGAVKQSE